MSYYVKIEWQTKSIYYSKFGVYFQDTQALPLLKTISNLKRVLIHHEICENSTASIELSDHSLHFTDKLNDEADRYCVGRKVTIFQGNNIVFTGYISSIPEIKGRICYITIDLFSFLNLPVNKQIKKEEFTKVPAENEGKWGNILFGNCSTISGKMFTAYRCGDNKYLAAWNTLSEIVVFKGDTNITPQITMSIDSSTGYTYIIYTSTENEITFSGFGSLDPFGSLIENPASMLHEFRTYTGITINNIDGIIAKFDDRTVYSQNCLYVNDDKNVKEFLSEFCFNFDCSLIFTRGGEFELSLINWGNISSKATPHPTIYKDFDSWKESDNLLKYAQRKYQYIPLSNKFNCVPQDLNATTNFNKVRKGFEHKFLQNNQTSWDVCARYVYIHQEQEEVTVFDIHPDLVLQLNLSIGDVITVIHRKSSYVEKLVLIRRESQNNDKSFIRFEGIDITSLTGTEFYLYDGDDERNPYLSDESDGPILL